MRDALEQYLERSKADKEGGVEAILVGTRRGDPHGGESTLSWPRTRTDACGGSALDPVHTDRLWVARLYARASNSRLDVRGDLGLLEGAIPLAGGWDDRILRAV
jgi:hypothetical protein